MQSDYTSKDFLAKLSIKPQFYETPQYLRFSHQPKVTSAIKKMVSPTAENANKIQFKALSSKRSPNHKLISSQIPHKPFSQISTIKIFKANNTVKDKLNPEFQTFTEDKAKIPNQNSLVQTPKQAVHEKLIVKSPSNEKVKLNINSQILNSEQDLMLKKTKMLLNTLLKDQISSSDILKITKKLEKGLKSSFQFDEIVQSQRNCKKQDGNGLKEEKPDKSKRKHKSLLSYYDHKQKAGCQKRFKSERKYIQIQRTKKQKKLLVGLIRSEILKQVKKMKQLVLVNQKSLKLSKKSSFK